MPPLPHPPVANPNAFSWWLAVQKTFARIALFYDNNSSTGKVDHNRRAQHTPHYES